METDAATITRLVRERQGLERELASARTQYQREVDARLCVERALRQAEDERDVALRHIGRMTLTNYAERDDS